MREKDEYLFHLLQEDGNILNTPEKKREKLVNLHSVHWYGKIISELLQLPLDFGIYYYQRQSFCIKVIVFIIKINNFKCLVTRLTELQN